MTDPYEIDTEPNAVHNYLAELGGEIPEYEDFLKTVGTLEEFAAETYEEPEQFQAILTEVDDILKASAEVSVGYNASVTASETDYLFETVDDDRIDVPVLKFRDGIREFKDKTTPSWTNLLNRSPADVRTDFGKFKVYFGVDEGEVKLSSDQLTNLTVKLPSLNTLKVYRGAEIQSFRSRINAAYEMADRDDIDYDTGDLIEEPDAMREELETLNIPDQDPETLNEKTESGSNQLF